MIYGLGMLESGLTFDFGQLVVDCEFARMIKHTINGFAVNDDTLAVDVIRSIGHFGDFLSHAHTFKGMRSQSRPTLIDRRGRTGGENKGGEMYRRAIEAARHIIKTHQPEPLPREVVDGIRNLVIETEKENEK